MTGEPAGPAPAGPAPAGPAAAWSAKRLDAVSLRGLAHPLRVRILGLLRADGPATATGLARRLGQDSGNVSWHLRQLARHGFIAEDTARGTRRERWWYALHEASQLTVADFPAGPESDELVTGYLRQVLAQHLDRAGGYLGEGWTWDWRMAANFSNWRLELTPDRLRALNAELTAVVQRHLAEAVCGEPGALPVHIQLQAFPRHGGPGAPGPAQARRPG